MPTTLKAISHCGLSPLARGNRLRPGACEIRDGPIPARAGEPKRFLELESLWRAYPRSRGGTCPIEAERQPHSGLSPLARGNLVHSKFPPGWRGPIPARAGEPDLHSSTGVENMAYPRSRGGTKNTITNTIANTGLSPLARGNRSHKCRCPSRWWAYPRSRGGTASRPYRADLARGLSPLARGNPISKNALLNAQGPIPARAGEPAGGIRCGFSIRAYPRSRGGTLQQRLQVDKAQGLSPLARGNRHHAGLQQRGHGPIPARAGEPLTPKPLRCKRKLQNRL